jgi:RNA polymerase subunit RPABC4/transcription elongation factor Spt4
VLDEESPDEWSGRRCVSKVPKRCGRCATVIERNELCPECMEYFQALGRWKVVFTPDPHIAETLVGDERQMNSVDYTGAKDNQ